MFRSVAAIATAVFALLLAQENVPIYRVSAVQDAIEAIHYQYGGAPAKIDFRGTVLLPDAKGEAVVQSRRDRTDIDARFEKLAVPTRFGQEYLTYVLWAISPDGNSYNLGEVLWDGSDRARVRVSTDLPAFGMMVTAEPYATANHPSSVVVLENHARPDTISKVQQVQPKAEAVSRGLYTFQAGDHEQAPNAPKVSMARYQALLHLYEAQNAVAAAQAANAKTYAPDAFAAAQRDLNEAQRLSATKANDKLVVQTAREAAQHAEDSRLIADRRRLEEQLAAAERAATRAEAEARQARADADMARQQASRVARESPGAAPAAEPAAPNVVPNQANREVREPEMHARLFQRIEGSFFAQDLPQGVVITLPDDSFDGINLRTAMSEKLAPLAAMLASQPGIRVYVQAYTDTGTSELQSWERAQAVRNQLVASGVASNQVAFRGMSAQASRRVEIVVSGGQ